MVAVLAVAAVLGAAALLERAPYERQTPKNKTASPWGLLPWKALLLHILLTGDHLRAYIQANSYLGGFHGR